ncbi:hypothetical protein Syun_030668 [Stephania yunnanensis]|uniref:Uncharacterized protein n=1 Tax=Stephania yunnanensis TaxID=152371 RepID=A0AAP0DXL7_9MAGN
MHMLTTTVTTNMLKDSTFDQFSDPLLIPREGMRKPMHMHIKVVPVSFDS